MASGMPPFNPEVVKPKDKAKDHEKTYVKMYEKIRMGDYEMKNHFSDNLKNFLTNIIQVDITRRYGNLKNGVDDIKKHAWFESIDWWKLYNKKLMIPRHYLPQNTTTDLAVNFHPMDENWTLETNKYPLYEKEFNDF
jgi:protein kinase A